jgi:hypothetical protein
MAFHLSKRISLFATTVVLATLVPSLAFAAPTKNGTMSQPHSTNLPVRLQVLLQSHSNSISVLNNSVKSRPF